MTPAPERDAMAARTWRRYLFAAWARNRKARAVSIGLMLAMIIVLLLGFPLFRDQGNPRHFALALATFFVFFFVVIARALSEVFDILREHVRERGRLYRTTLGDAAFARNLGRRVMERQDKP
ncbi:MAG TPA: hypothetical protein PLO62_02630 [Candidatus Hydrogenedentes bacterium]|nr:hypothetical protein [Candidatus Hydrogenedentota bacterium]HOS02026.1 hypothetical protein [Candidatus Hydrogenedentota bacterium]